MPKSQHEIALPESHISISLYLFAEPCVRTYLRGVTESILRVLVLEFYFGRP